MADNLRDRAREILKIVPPYGQQINSDGPTAALFTKLTGKTHASLVADWAGGSKITTCNEFVRWFIMDNLGSPRNLGRFDLETYMPKIGKADAWIPATSGAKPKVGDIFRCKKFHVAISHDMDEDGTWNTVESGQGGSIAQRDIIKRKRQPFDATTLIGWVDIEIYFGAAAASVTPPAPETNPPVLTSPYVPEGFPSWRRPFFY